jgi:aspartate carbamoyltransferase regulatory subunit
MDSLKKIGNVRISDVCKKYKIMHITFMKPEITINILKNNAKFEKVIKEEGYH